MTTYRKPLDTVCKYWAKSTSRIMAAMKFARYFRPAVSKFARYEFHYYIYYYKFRANSVEIEIWISNKFHSVQISYFRPAVSATVDWSVDHIRELSLNGVSWIYCYC